MWTYRITDHTLTDGGDHVFSEGVYAGHGKTLAEGRNNPNMQHVRGRGPLPVGDYRIEAPHDSPHTGPYTMNLVPEPTNEMFGRSLFRIHGDNSQGDASDGCIAAPKGDRVIVWTRCLASGDYRLRVTL